MKSFFLLSFSLAILFAGAQTKQKLRTENDRKFLLENLQRSKDELVKETQNLTEAQWNFKESADRWSIRQVVEHIGIWNYCCSGKLHLLIWAAQDPSLQQLPHLIV